MKKNYSIEEFEKGQIIPLVVLTLVVIIAMVAIITDGGALMSSRRIAQAAADAGALAGAERVCLGHNDAQTVAQTYATVNNKATSATVTVTGKQVLVTATLQYPSFFGKLLGDDTLEARAQAEAGCFGVKGNGVIPLAWACYPNTGGPYPSQYGCQMQTLSWKQIGPLVDPNWDPPSERVTTLSISDYEGNVRTYKMSGTSIVDAATSKIPPEQIYIIYDGVKICSGTICDLDGDGKNDILVGGDRGYLYLDNISTHNLKDFLDLGTINIDTHLWFSGKSGNDVALINAMVSHSYPGKVVLLPVYNTLCSDDPSTHPACGTPAHASPPWPVFTGSDDFSQIRNQNPYYHVIAFAPFYISCVDNQGACPGYTYAKTKDSTLPTKAPIIEGYFLTDVDVTPDSTQDCSIDLGNCTVSLTQ